MESGEEMKSALEQVLSSVEEFENYLSRLSISHMTLGNINYVFELLEGIKQRIFIEMANEENQK